LKVFELFIRYKHIFSISMTCLQYRDLLDIVHLLKQKLFKTRICCAYVEIISTKIIPSSSRIGWPSLYRRHHELVDRHYTVVITNWLTIIIPTSSRIGWPSLYRRHHELVDRHCTDVMTKWLTVIIQTSSRIGWPSLYRRHHELVDRHYTVVITNWMTVIIQASSRIGWSSLYRHHHKLDNRHFTGVITNWLTVIIPSSSRIGWRFSNGNVSFPFYVYFIFLFHRHDFYCAWLFVTRWVS
jgi:hypothetical protein